MLLKSLKQSLPRPLFLLSASLMAYLSILILTFKRQEKNLAMYYLCGASKRKSTMLTFITFTIIALIPILLVVAFIVSWEPLNISGEINSMYRDYLREADKNGTHYTNMEELYPGWKGFVLEQFGGAINNRIQKLINLDIKLVNLWIVFGFYGITALVAFLVTWLSMRKHSPLTYLRGVNE
jgi:uncharacterized membrane protein